MHVTWRVKYLFIIPISINQISTILLVFHRGRLELGSVNGGDELFRNRQLNVVIIVREHDVHRVALGSNNLGIHGVLGQDDLDRGGLVNGEVGDLALALDIDALAVHDFATANNVLEDNAESLATVDNNGVDLSRDDDSGALTLVDVDSVLGFQLFRRDLDAVVANVVFNHPLVTLEDWALRRQHLLDSGRGSRGGFLLFLDGLDNATSTESGVLVGLHVLRDLLQASRNVRSLVQRSEEGVGVSGSTTSRLLGGIIGHQRSGRGRRTRRRGTSSRGSRGSRGSSSSCSDGINILSVGVPLQASGVVLLDVHLQLGEELLQLVAPINLPGGKWIEKKKRIIEMRVDLKGGPGLAPFP
jgi:hypothetical protein